MKKKNLIKKLQLKKTQVSNFQQGQIVGGSRIGCGPIDLSALETCYVGCGLTVTCTQFNTCNDVSFFKLHGTQLPNNWLSAGYQWLPI